jgi:hypothetical protein
MLRRLTASSFQTTSLTCTFFAFFSAFCAFSSGLTVGLWSVPWTLTGAAPSAGLTSSGA